jgi:hypothetical protein
MRPRRKNSSFARMLVKSALRLDKEIKAEIAPVSQMSSSEKPLLQIPLNAR